MEEFFLCIDKHVFLFGGASSGWDGLGCLFAGLADHQTIVTPSAGFVRPLSFGDFFSEGQSYIPFIFLSTFKGLTYLKRRDKTDTLSES